MSAKLNLTGRRSRYYSPELPGYLLYPGGQSAPEPSPLDRRMFGKKCVTSAIVLLRSSQKVKKLRSSTEAHRR